MNRPFRSDCCSGVLDLDAGMRAACILHDWQYWKGGGWRDRLRADNNFAINIWQWSRYRWLAPVRWLGVRLLASPLCPLSWTPWARRRWAWGYGWDRGNVPSQGNPGPYSDRTEWPKLVKALEGVKRGQA